MIGQFLQLLKREGRAGLLAECASILAGDCLDGHFPPSLTLFHFSLTPAM